MRYPLDDSVFTEDEYENKLLLHKPKFQNGVQRLRQKWDIPKDGFTSDGAQQVWENKLFKKGAHEYKSDIIFLLRLLELSDRWYSGVSAYIKMNAPSVLKVRSNLPVRVDYDEDGEHRNIHSLWLQVDRDTTQREIVEAFKAAQDMFGPPKDKKQKPDPENLDRDLALLERHRDGLKNKELAAWLNENYPGAFNTEDVKTILKRIKRKLS